MDELRNNIGREQERFVQSIYEEYRRSLYQLCSNFTERLYDEINEEIMGLPKSKIESYVEEFLLSELFVYFRRETDRIDGLLDEVLRGSFQHDKDKDKIFNKYVEGISEELSHLNKNWIGDIVDEFRRKLPYKIEYLCDIFMPYIGRDILKKISDVEDKTKPSINKLKDRLYDKHNDVIKRNLQGYLRKVHEAIQEYQVENKVDELKRFSNIVELSGYSLSEEDDEVVLQNPKNGYNYQIKYSHDTLSLYNDSITYNISNEMEVFRDNSLNKEIGYKPLGSDSYAYYLKTSSEHTLHIVKNEGRWYFFCDNRLCKKDGEKLFVTETFSKEADKAYHRLLQDKDFFEFYSDLIMNDMIVMFDDDDKKDDIGIHLSGENRKK